MKNKFSRVAQQGAKIVSTVRGAVNSTGRAFTQGRNYGRASSIGISYANVPSLGGRTQAAFTTGRTIQQALESMKVGARRVIAYIPKAANFVSKTVFTLAAKAYRVIARVAKGVLVMALGIAKGVAKTAGKTIYQIRKGQREAYNNVAKGYLQKRGTKKFGFIGKAKPWPNQAKLNKAAKRAGGRMMIASDALMGYGLYLAAGPVINKATDKIFGE